MFFFITTLRHPKNAKNYDSVISLLQLTIESVCNQDTDFPYKLLVVCNQVPSIDVDHDKVEFLAVDYPPPGEGKADKLSLRDMHFDKGIKLAAGMLYMKQFNPSSVFIIDADDWVNKDIVNHVMSLPNTPFWFADTGYLVNYADKKVIRKHGLCRYCGTAFIYDYKKLMSMLNFKSGVKYNAPRESLIEAIDDYPLVSILGNHRFQFSYLQRFNFKIKALPFKSICWILNTGENHSGKTGGYEGLPLTQQVLSEFGIQSVSPSNAKLSVNSLFKEWIAKMKSHWGWITTNKKAEKV